MKLNFVDTMDEVLKIALEAPLPELKEETPAVLESGGAEHGAAAGAEGASPVASVQRSVVSVRRGRLGIELAFYL